MSAYVPLWGVAITIVFLVIKHTMGLRCSREEEIRGLDVTEHGLMSSYADFMPMNVQVLDGSSELESSDALPEEKPVSVAQAVRVQRMSSDLPDHLKMTKVVMIIKQSKFEELKSAMNGIGVTGMTVTQVLGCGMQKGASEYYRGVPVDVSLLPKVKVEFVVCKVPVDTVVATAKKVLYTGHIGDGKIFIYDVENVIKVRTGEEGYDALQDEE